MTIKGTTTAFNYDRNRLLTATTGASTSSYNYDPFGRLDTVTAAGQVLERNVYDGFDHIVENRKTAGGTTSTTRYTFDPLDLICQLKEEQERAALAFLWELTGIPDVISCWSGSPSGCGLVAASILGGGAGKFLKGARIATGNNYADLFCKAHPETPSDYQVHHALPQKYEDIIRRVGVNIHETYLLRGVDPRVHSQITTEWRRFERGLGRTPTAQEITMFSYHVDQKYGAFFIFG